MSRVLDDRHYSNDHEWVLLKDGKAYVGITDHAQEALGEIVYVELPETDEEFSKGDEISNIESVKAASAIINPVGGKVSKINEALDDVPELINQDAYENWIYVMEDFSQEDYDSLLDKAGYEEFLRTLD